MAYTPHKNPGYDNRIAIAPYNFVPLSARAITNRPSQQAGQPSVDLPLAHDRYWEDEAYTGQFDCTLTAETLLYIRGLLSEDDVRKGKDAKDLPAPYQVDGQLRLPGSSLRGLFRALVEVLSCSKMSAVTNAKQVYRAVDMSSLGQKYRGRIMEEIEHNVFVPRVKAGYVRDYNGQWFIQPAEEIGGVTWCRIGERFIPEGLQAWPPAEVRETQGIPDDVKTYNARTVYMQPTPNQFQEVRGDLLKIKFARAMRASAAPGAGLRPAALAYSGKMLSKRSEAIIFQPDPQRNTPDKGGWWPLRYTEGEGEAKREVKLDLDYRDQVSDQQAVMLGNPQLEDAGGKKTQDRRGALRDFQPVFYLIENGKLVFFGHTLMLRLPYLHSPADMTPSALRDEQALDLAEAIFGYADHKGMSKEQPSFAGRVSFSDAAYTGNLSGSATEDVFTPKVLSTPKPTTFQHYLAQMQPDDMSVLRDYDDATTVRGHKLYWHKGKIGRTDVEEHDDQKKMRHRSQYTQIQPVKAGAAFVFMLRFENLRRVELGALAWVLKVAGDEKYRLKLGMGKPHGMGAVRVASALTLTDRTARYTSVFEGEGWALGARSTAEAQSVLKLALDAFEAWVLSDDENNPGRERNLLSPNLPRMKELLTLLAWPGPNPEYTRYMEIERVGDEGRRENEYRLRPVLPLPSAVGKPATKGPYAPTVRAEPERRPLSPRPARDVIAQPPPPPKLEPLPEVREEVSAEAMAFAANLGRAISEGDVFTVEVIRANANEYECRLDDGNQHVGRLPRDENKNLKVGDKIVAKVKRIAFTGAMILTVKGVKKP